VNGKKARKFRKEAAVAGIVNELTYSYWGPEGERTERYRTDAGCFHGGNVRGYKRGQVREARPRVAVAKVQAYFRKRKFGLK